MIWEVCSFCGAAGGAICIGSVHQRDPLTLETSIESVHKTLWFCTSCAGESKKCPGCGSPVDFIRTERFYGTYIRSKDE